jgi:hypothetical protein
MQFRSRLIAAIGTLVLGLGIGLVSAGAVGAATQQQMIRIPTGAQIDVGAAFPCAPGDIVITVASGHDHFFTNPNGDFWENATIQGTAALVDPVTGTVLETGGHAEAWFGTESNNGAQVFHFNDKAQFPSGRIQQNGQFTVNANGIPVVSRVTANCG